MNIFLFNEPFIIVNIMQKEFITLNTQCNIHFLLLLTVFNKNKILILPKSIKEGIISSLHGIT